MLKKLTVIIILILVFSSCKNDTSLKPAFVKLEYTSNEDLFLESINIGDSTQVFMKVQTSQFLNSTTRTNTLGLRLYFGENQILDEALLESTFKRLKNKVQKEILNYDAYDVFLLEFYKGETEFAKKEEVFK